MTDKPTRAEALLANHNNFIEARRTISDAWREADLTAYAAYLAEMERIEAEYPDE